MTYFFQKPKRNMQTQTFSKGKSTTLNSATETMLIALHELPGNHLVIPPVTQMNLSSALSAMWDMRRQQVKNSQEHLHLDDTISPEMW